MKQSYFVGGALRGFHAVQMKSFVSTNPMPSRALRISARGPGPDTETSSGRRGREGRASGANTGAPWIVWPMRRGCNSTMWAGERSCRSDVGRRAVVPKQRAAQQPARPPITPERVVVRVREEAARQMLGLAGGEAVDRVDGGAPRQTLGPVPPAHQAPRVNRQFVPRAEQAKHQVVVLGPTAVPIGESLEDLASQHQCGVGDRAFDEALAPHRGRVSDGVEPTLVGATPLRHRAARKDSYATSDTRQPGLVVEHRELQGQAIAMHPIIGVHTRHVSAAALGEPEVQRRDDAAMGFRENAKSLVDSGVVPKDRGARVVGTIVHRHAFPIHRSLAKYAVEASAQRLFRAVDGEQQRDCRNRGFGALFEPHHCEEEGPRSSPRVSSIVASSRSVGPPH